MVNGNQDNRNWLVKVVVNFEIIKRLQNSGYK